MEKKYRILKTGEKLKKGDEARDSNSNSNSNSNDTPWIKMTVCLGETLEENDFVRGCKYRRPTKLKKTYRILRDNERICSRDQGYDARTRGWFLCKEVAFCGQFVRQAKCSDYITRFRREVKA